MATPTAATGLTPERIFNTLNAHEQTAALLTAIALDIFSAIGAGANTAAAIASKTGAADKGARVLCDFLTVHGFLTKEQGKYGLTQESAFFLDRSKLLSRRGRLEEKDNCEGEGQEECGRKRCHRKEFGREQRRITA